MKLKKFSILNFRSMNKASLPISDLTTIIGPNNEGKSNILQALVTALRLLELIGLSPARFGSRPIPSFRFHRVYDWERDFPVGMQESKPDGESTFTLVFELTDEERQEFKAEVKSGLKGELPIEIAASQDGVTFKVRVKGPGAKEKSKKPDLIARFVGRRLDFQYIPAIRPAATAQATVAEMVSRELEGLEEEPKYRKAMAAIEQLERPILAYLSERVKTTLTAFLPDIVNVDVQIPPERRHRAVRQSCDIIIDDGTPTPLDQKGDGVQSLAAISLMRHASERAAKGKHLLLAIEEPESHLHPEAIHELRTVLHDISKTRQVVITSHSPLFVDRTDLRSNILVSDKKAACAKTVQEIRDILGVRAADNLRHAELVLLVEGQHDKTAITALLGHASKRLNTALRQGTLAIDTLIGAHNLAYKLGEIQTALCSGHSFLDNDLAGRQAAEKAKIQGLIEDANINFAICNGMKDSELEDLYDPQLYSDFLRAKFRVSLDSKSFRNKKSAWKGRMRDTFRKHGKQWDAEMEQDVKRHIAKLVAASPSTALSANKREAFDSLVKALEDHLGESAR